MVRRKRTAIENFFNLNRYRKRSGAASYTQDLAIRDYEKLKRHTLEGKRPEMFQSYMIKNLDEHMAHLQTAFTGQPELLFYHAKLIVLIRREADLPQNVKQFRHLWEHESDFLLEHLNMRWLVAAIDTFIDHPPNKTFAAVLLNAILLINTIKLYETERFLLGMEHTNEFDYEQNRYTDARANCFNLFDELPSFRIGIDDTFRNMRWRMDAVAKSEPLAHKLLMAVFARANERGSAYTRFRNRHEKPRNEWW